MRFITEIEKRWRGPACRRMVDSLPAYLDGALPPRRARLVSEHLSACPRCRQERRSFEIALHALDRVGRETPAIDLWVSFSHRLAAENSVSRTRTRAGVFYLQRALSGLAAGALAAAVCLWSLGTTRLEPLLQPRERSLTASVSKPDNLEPSAPTAEGTSATLPAVRSPEQIIALLPSKPAQASSISSQMTRAIEQGPRAAGTSARPLQQTAALPTEDLVSMVDALMDAQQSAAQAEVAREMLVLAEGILRHHNEAAIIHPEDRS